MNKIFVTFIVLFSSYFYVKRCVGLECYFCKNVNGNNGPCIRNHMTCTQTKPSCMSKVQWSDHPYGSKEDEKDRNIYVSKACMSTSDCNSLAAKYRANCTRELYRDWTCIECCSHDFCNYNVPTMNTDINSSPSSIEADPKLNEVLEY